MINLLCKLQYIIEEAIDLEFGFVHGFETVNDINIPYKMIECKSGYIDIEKLRKSIKAYNELTRLRY